MKRVCTECPFRRESAPGWIGEHKDVREIINIVQFDGHFPCHMEVTKRTNRGEPFKDAVSESPFCKGALHFMRNSCKRHADPAVQEQVEKAGKSKAIFTWPAEMEEHHRSRK